MNLHSNMKIQTSMSATLSAVQSRTGREVVADKLYDRACAWARNPGMAELDLEAEFITHLPSVPLIPTDSLRCYRGRSLSVADKPHRHDFGPPPISIMSVANRYNGERKRALYLCNSLQGVARELARREDVWAQEYELPQSLRIADFRVGSENDLLSKIFWITENAETRENGYPYKFGQYLAEIISKQFDGMAVPGVRGNKSERYFNIVILKRIDEWKSWVHAERNPVRIL